MRKALVILALAALVALSGCSLFGGRVAFYSDGGETAKGTRGMGYRVDQLNISTSGSTGIPTVWAEDTEGSRVPIQPQGDPTCIDVSPEGSASELSVAGVTQGEAVIETTDGAAQLPVVVYNNCVIGQPGYVYPGFFVTATGHESTPTRELAHFWREWRDDAGQNCLWFKSLVPAYCADAGTDIMEVNFDRLAAIKTVDTEQLAAAPAETWLELNRIYVSQVPGGYVKIVYTSNQLGLLWFFSPTPDFP
jgi:hypothetical protein